MTEKRFTSDIHRIYDNNEEIACADTMDDAEILVDLLNEQEERIQDLLRYKYLVKALEEVSGGHYIEEIISDYSDGAVSDEKEQLELGKWHSEHGLSWEDGDVDD
jgi:hypothetical protein